LTYFSPLPPPGSISFLLWLKDCLSGPKYCSEVEHIFSGELWSGGQV
jgi:hypothetical protein